MIAGILSVSGCSGSAMGPQVGSVAEGHVPHEGALRPTSRGGVELATPIRAATQRRRDVAFLVGASDYERWPDLPNGTVDVTAIGRELERRYGFEVHYLFDLTKAELQQRLIELKAIAFEPVDQLLVYVTGHGYYNDLIDLGFLVPTDARLPADDRLSDTLLSSLYIVEQLNGVRAEHLLVVLDVCYGGSLFYPFSTRGARPPAVDVAAFVDDVLQYKTRRWIASSDRGPVSDGAPGRHSPFARRFLEALRIPDEDGVKTIADVMSRVQRVGLPRPVTGELAGNEPGSDFLFIERRCGFKRRSSRQMRETMRADCYGTKR